MNPHAFKKSLAATLLVTLAQAPTPAAAGQVFDIQWGADGVFERHVRVQPGRFVEVCGKLNEAQRIQWQFEAADPLEFNIHFHEGKVVKFPVATTRSRRLDGVLNVPTTQDYCWMWTHRGEQVQNLHLRLVR